MRGVRARSNGRPRVHTLSWYFVRLRGKEKGGAKAYLLLIKADFRWGETALVNHSAGCPTALPSLFSDAMIESRIGFTTNSASPTTMKFMIAATANTPCQLPV